MNYQEEIRRKSHPKVKSNILASLLFLYTIPLFILGWKRGLIDDDMYDVPPKYQSKTLFSHLIKQWRFLQSSKKQSVFRLLWKSYGLYFLFLGVIKILVNTFLLIFQPFAISNIVAYFVPNQTEISKSEAYLFAGALILVKLLNAIYEHNNRMWIAALGIRMRGAMFCFIYRKIFSIDFTKVDNVEVGKIVTMITKDIQSFQSFLVYGNDIWSSTLTTAFGCVLLYRKIGTAALAGIAVLWAIIPLQIYSTFKSAYFERKVCERTEKRYRLVQEAVAAIKIIKMYTWENMFKAKITSARKKEIWSIYFILVIRTTIIGLSVLSVYVAQYVLLIVHTKLGNKVTAQIVFFMITSFRLIRENFTIRLSIALTFFGKLFPCVKRIDKLLKLPEIDNKTNKICSSIVEISHMNHKIFGKINLQLENNAFVVVTGRTSSGKTTLLKTILGEYGGNPLKETISYVSQEPWLFPSTIRQNIVFGENFNRNRYQKVLKVCALDHDIETFENGDLTIIEDGGFNLSKGQRSRINLARAVYRNSDVYLIDNCLSSLDAVVRFHILEKCFCKFLQMKLVILVSQNISDFEYADQIITMENGQIKSVKKGKQVIKVTHERSNHTGRMSFSKVENNDNDDDDEYEDDQETETIKLLNQVSQKRIYTENIKPGKVVNAVYMRYIKSGGGFIVLFLLIIMHTVNQIMRNYTDTFLRNWVDLEQQISRISSNDTLSLTQAALKKESIIFKYTIVVLVLFVLTLGRTFVSFIFTTRSSINIHKKALNILDASMEFFNKHFIGNIFNRFSKDFNIIDELLPMSCYLFIIELLQIVGVVILVSIVNKVFLIFSLALFVLLALSRWMYLKTSRCLQRLDAATRSPVVGYINSTLDGISTIRAFNVEKTLISEFDQHLNHFTSVTYTLMSSTFAFTLILELLSVLFTTAILIKLLIFDDGRTTAGNVGLALSQASLLVLNIKTGIHRWAEMENCMTSVERVFEYSDTKLEDKTGVKKLNWPNHGEIKFNNVCLTYPNTTKQVLKNLTFTVNAEEKLAIVGRTGAGKSTIFSALCRLYDIEGKISIDEVDIATVPLQQLRSNISLIPQDAVLFSGTVRDNIDPKRQCSDEELWNIIKSTNLSSVVTNLDEELADRGVYLSVGQKQLFSVARALACKTKIVLLDEATANLDSENVSLIQKTIQDTFASCTVIIIAHTTKTVMNCDKLLILDNGVIVEKGKPKQLLENKNGVFYKLYQRENLSLL